MWGIEEIYRYEKAQERKEWYVAYSEEAERHQDQFQKKREHQDVRTVECTVCGSVSRHK